MKRKIVSIFTALMVLTTIALIIGCHQPQNSNNDSNQSNNGSTQGSNGSNQSNNGNMQSSNGSKQSNNGSTQGSNGNNQDSNSSKQDSSNKQSNNGSTQGSNGSNQSNNGSTQDSNGSKQSNNGNMQSSNGSNQSNTGSTQGSNDSKQRNTNPLVGVWEITQDGLDFPNLSRYILFTADGITMGAIKPKTQGAATAMDTGLRRSSRESKYTVSVEKHSFTFPVNGKTETLSYMLEETKLTVTGQKEFEAVKVSSPTEDEIKNAQTYD